MTGSLLILGCGGHGRVVADTAFDCGYERIAFLDDGEPARIPAGTRLLGPMAAADGLVPTWPAAMAAVGNCQLRLELLARLRKLRFSTPTLIHPSSVVSRSAILGEGVFVAAGAVVNADARIGDAVIVNTGAHIDHDCVIGAGSHIAPGVTLSGNVIVGVRSWLGTGCSVRQGVKIGSDVVVGVGAAVVGDLPNGNTYAGVPARILDRP